MFLSQPLFFKCFQSPSSRECLSTSARYYVNGVKDRMAAQFFSNFSSKAQLTKEFIEPMVKERFAKMDELGETWDDAPVRNPVPAEILLLTK
jgi:hypothetical protein